MQRDTGISTAPSLQHEAKVKILILANHLEHSLGGIEIQCDLIAREVLAAGHSVVYGTPAFIEPLSKDYPYSIESCDLATPKSLVALIHKAKPDVIYLRNNKNRLRVMARTAHQCGVPVVFAASSLQDVQPWAYHASQQPWTPRRIASVLWQRLKSRWNWSGFRYVSAAVSLNPDYTERLPVALRLHIPDSMDAAVEPFSWPRPYVAWVAQLKDYKHPEEFVELARRCADTGLDFLMVGGLAHQRFSWIARHQGTPDNFHYLGPMTLRQVNGFLAASRMLVHTCEPEGFGNNFIQAWLQRRATLSLHFDPAGTIERHQLGYVPGNMDALEASVRQLLADSQLLDAMGQRAYQHAVTHYSPVTNVARLVEVFRRVVSQGAAL